MTKKDEPPWGDRQVSVWAEIGWAASKPLTWKDVLRYTLWFIGVLIGITAAAIATIALFFGLLWLIMPPPA